MKESKGHKAPTQNKKESLLKNQFNQIIDKYNAVIPLRGCHFNLDYLNDSNTPLKDKCTAYHMYIESNGVDGMKALIGFVFFAEDDEDIIDIQITGCINHDLNSIWDRMLSPKSSTFGKFYKEEEIIKVPKCTRCEGAGLKKWSNNPVVERDIKLNGDRLWVECQKCEGSGYSE